MLVLGHDVGDETFVEFPGGDRLRLVLVAPSKRGRTRIGFDCRTDATILRAKVARKELAPSAVQVKQIEQFIRHATRVVHQTGPGAWVTDAVWYSNEGLLGVVTMSFVNREELSDAAKQCILILGALTYEWRVHFLLEFKRSLPVDGGGPNYEPQRDPND